MSTPQPPPQEPSALDRAALARTAPARDAMKAEDAPHYTLDAIHAAGVALGIVGRVAPYREKMATLPDFDLAKVDAFKDCALALRCVQTELGRRVERGKLVPELAKEGWRLRSQMLAFADALSYRGRVEPELVARLREGSGYKDLVEDLLILVQELLAQPGATLGPDAPVTREEVERAAVLAHEINVRMGDPADLALTPSVLVAERRKLGGLLLQSYSEVRRGMSHFRWHHGDLDALVPSLYVPGGRKPRAQEAPSELVVLVDPLADRVAPTAAAEDSPFVADDDEEE